MNTVYRAPLHWFDLALVVLLLWAGVGGWIQGWKGTAWKLGALLAALPLAAIWRGELQSFFSLCFPVDEAIRAVIASRLAVPVSAPTGEPGLFWPAAVWDWLRLSPDWGLTTWPSPADCLARALYNAAAFGLALTVWGSAVYLAGTFFMKQKGIAGSLAARIAGFLAGMARGSMLAVLVLGLSVPFLSLAPGIWEWSQISQARFYSAALHLFNMTGIWWH